MVCGQYAAGELDGKRVPGYRHHRELIDALDDREPATAPLRHTLERARIVDAADQDRRMGLLSGLGKQRTERSPRSYRDTRKYCPAQCLHGGDVILELAPAMFEVATEDGRFLRVPSCADAK